MLYNARKDPATRRMVAEEVGYHLDTWAKIPPAPPYLAWDMMCKHVRVLLGKSQVEMGEYLGVSARTIVGWEAGRTFSMSNSHSYQICFNLVEQHRKFWQDRAGYYTPPWSTDHLEVVNVKQSQNRLPVDDVESAEAAGAESSAG
jgi:DNA-binding XRE family transcriptional regulator